MAASPLTLRELVLQTRIEINDLPGDVEDPCAWINDDSGLRWSNAELTRYLNDAKDEFTRRIPIIDRTTAADSNSLPICSISVTAGTREYAISPRVFVVRDVYSTVHEKRFRKKDRQWLDLYDDNWRTTTGEPSYYILNDEHFRLTLNREPEVNDTLELVVWRLPLLTMDWNKSVTDSPTEVPSVNHEDLIYWAIHRAYRKRDTQTFRPNLSAQYKNMFEERVGPVMSAKRKEMLYRELETRREALPHWF